MSLPMLQTARLLLGHCKKTMPKDCTQPTGTPTRCVFLGLPPTETRRLRQRAELIRGVLLICRVR